MSTIKPIVLLPLPLENAEVWRQFRSFAERFACTWRHNPPGTDVDLVVLCCKNLPSPDVQAIFTGLPARFVLYDGDGADLGSQQWFAKQIGCGDGVTPFLICCTTRCYFHREGWAKRLVEAREAHGPGLYGISCSYEGGRLHVCTRGYCIDAADLRDFPLAVISRDQGVPFECGEGSITRWMSARMRSRNDIGGPLPENVPTSPTLVDGSAYSGLWMVYWDGVWSFQDWFNRPNTFRKGDQSNMLIWDKHTDLWALSSPMEKQVLSRRCFSEGKSATRIAAILPLKIDREKSTLDKSIAQMKAVCDEVLVLRDNDNQPAPELDGIVTELLHAENPPPWNDFVNRLTLMARACKYNCPWVMQLDDDETMGPTLTPARCRELCELADAGGFGQVVIRVRTAWNETQWRTDGVFGQQDKSFLVKNALMLKHPKFRYGPDYTLHHFPTLDAPMLYAPPEDYIIHWGVRTPRLREKNAAKYLAQDPAQKFTGVEYDYLLKTEGITLEDL